MREIASVGHDGKPVNKEVFEKLIKQLTDQQFKAAWIAANEDEKGIIWHKIGEGKTRVAITWSFMIAREPRPLVICSPQAIRQWKDEIVKLGIKDLIKPSFISYGILSRKNTLIVDFARYNCIIVDELWLFKNYKSNRSVMIHQITNRLPSIGLSGNMMTAGNLEDIYGQAKAMNLDKKLANNITSFRNQFMVATTNFRGFIERYPRKGAIEVIQRRLIDNVDIYFPKERKEIRDIYINVDPTLEQRDIKRQLLKTYNFYDTNFSLDVRHAANMLVKMQQVSDGFLKDNQGNFLYCRSNKMGRLKELCTELLDAGERIIIWVSFKTTAKMLSKILPWKTTILSGDGGFDVYGWRAGKIKVSIATVSSGASLNDFADVRYSIFYSTSFSNVHFQQARGRTNRKSTPHSCLYYYYLSTNKFPDRHIYELIEDNNSREETVINVAKRVLEKEREEIKS